MQLDLNLSRTRRDAGIAKTSSRNSSFIAASMDVLMSLRDRKTITGEQLRYEVLTRLNMEPTSPHVWGSIIRTAVKRRILRDSGRTGQMQDVRSHARRTPIWEFV